MQALKVLVERVDPRDPRAWLEGEWCGSVEERRISGGRKRGKYDRGEGTHEVAAR